MLSFARSSDGRQRGMKMLAEETPMSARDDAWTFEGWVEYVFDRPVAAPEWWFGFGGELPADPPPAEAVAFVTRLCEHADALLAPYSNAQVNQGLWYLVGSGASGL